MKPDFGLKYSFEQWMEAHIAVVSRNFGDPKGSPNNLVPFIELFNHSNPPDVLWKFEDDEQGGRYMRLLATRDIAKGE